MEEYSIEVRDRTGGTLVLPLTRLPFSIGRESGNDLVIPEPPVSRRHASIQCSGDGLAVVDNESRNGVFVNGKKISGTRRLHPGDILRIGATTFKLALSGAPDVLLASQQPATVNYFPSRGKWDPSETLAGPFPARAVTPVGESKPDGTPRWESLLRIFLQASTVEMHEHILDLIQETVPFDRCFILFFSTQTPDDVKVVAKRVHKNLKSNMIISRDILRRVVERQESVIVRSRDLEFMPTQSFIDSGASSALCVPLTVEGDIHGAIYLDRLFGLDLSQKELEALGPLAGLVALKLENLRLHHGQAISEVVARDLKLAKQIVAKLLPQAPISLPGFSVEGYTSACYEVGGDYFDFVWKENNKLILVVGDVSGKGLPSALYMAGVRAALHACLNRDLQVDRLMCELERHTESTFQSHHFLTLFLGELDTQTGVLRYCNAGHLPPICLRPSAKIVELKEADPALNIVSWKDFHLHEHRMAPGEHLLLYTDGLTEEQNSSGEQFGKQRLVSCLSQHRDKELAFLRNEILTEIDAFSGHGTPRDDRTLVLIRREGNQ